MKFLIAVFHTFRYIYLNDLVSQSLISNYNNFRIFDTSYTFIRNLKYKINLNNNNFIFINIRWLFLISNLAYNYFDNYKLNLELSNQYYILFFHIQIDEYDDLNLDELLYYF